MYHLLYHLYYFHFYCLHYRHCYLAIATNIVSTIVTSIASSLLLSFLSFISCIYPLSTGLKSLQCCLRHFYCLFYCSAVDSVLTTQLSSLLSSLLSLLLLLEVLLLYLLSSLQLSLLLSLLSSLLSFYYLTNFTSVMITPMVSMLCYASLIYTIVQLSSLPLLLLRTKFKSFSKVCPASVAALYFCIPLQSDCRLCPKLIW